MNYHIAYGTDDYLKDYMEKHQNEEGKFYLLEHSGDAMLIHKTTGDSVFESGHTYEAIEESGSFENAGYAVFNNIPVSIEGRPLFEDRFKERAGLVEKEPGCEGLAILRPLDTETYVIATMWKDERDFEAWRSSSSYEKAHKERDTSNALPQSVFSGKPYLKTYNLIASS
ncbi:antibiotic biosynthesis monooxygenase family protein [Pseudalkalibacillus decolorationis]|uniref:antibiotic biosynthesis monooxygenase family protein n=1 Tax=Pseudalkalibacillus decolorationis TaxID=163879 RepID=UPI002148E3C6|nr:antibiotic biosynthesis monooxygenase [Pseudalkalibacillus decolorationis]